MPVGDIYIKEFFHTRTGISRFTRSKHKYETPFLTLFSVTHTHTHERKYSSGRHAKRRAVSAQPIGSQGRTNDYTTDRQGEQAAGRGGLSNVDSENDEKSSLKRQEEKT